MCCFSGHVSDVSGTNIFARVSGDREYLAYEMTFTSDVDTAMILPIPTASATTDDVVEFLSLENYADFFRDLDAHFERMLSNVKLLGLGARELLKVQLVGAYEASFVPSVDQFDRLDARFRIPHHVWQQLPAYSSFGFVVFKLHPGKRVNVHPMAFSFRTRDPATLFFPTVHIHDGTVHETADFDHLFYTQNKPARKMWPGDVWLPGNQPASQYLEVSRTHGLADPDAICFRTSLVGPWRNADMVIPI